MTQSSDRRSVSAHRLAAGISRRRFIEFGAGTTAGLLVWRFEGGRALAQPAAGGVLDPHSIPKYVEPLVIPPAMPRTHKLPQKRGRSVDYYEIAVREFRQPILPESMGLEATRVWSYGSVNHPGSFNYPAFTIEADWRRPVRVKWINGLVKPNGDFLPHLLPVDQTLHWANPPGGAQGRDRHGDDQSPYGGPVPIVTHLHGGHSAEWSDGYPEAWFLPAARNIPRATPGGEVSTGGSGKRTAGARAGLDAWQRRLSVRQRPARRDDVVPRPHARDDPLQRVCGAGRVLPLARRARRRRAGDPAGPCAGARRPARPGLLRDPDRDPGSLVHREGRAVLPRQSCVLRGSRAIPAPDPVHARPRLRRAERHRPDLEPGVLRQRDRRERPHLALA